jgi:FMN hydrolase / 5-amino-6-(5-phospho-D-ribitylamino)uracil phosphatase
MSSPTLLALDLMDTVVRDPVFTVVPERMGCSLAEAMQQLDVQAWRNFELGLIDEAAYLQSMFRPGLATPPLPPQAVRKAILTGFLFVEGMEPLLRELKSRSARIWALSNYPSWVETLRRELSLDRFFEGYVVSYQIGARKPDPKMFLALCQQTRVAANDCVLVDDRVENVDGARRFGMTALLFSGSFRLREDLTALGIL